MTTSQKGSHIHAWADESGSVHALDPGTYLLAASVGPADIEDESRRAMRALRLPGQKKLHWRDERDRRQRAITTAVSELGCSHLVVVRTGHVTDTFKRRRNKCLERLLTELEALGVDQVTFESRGRTEDRRDLDLVQALRGQHLIGTTLRIQHAPGPTEPMLWVPDAVCGAVTSARTGNDEHLARLGDKVTLINI